MEKICFVISPMGYEESPTRARADYVLKTYIEPACQMTGFRAVRADHGIGQDIVKGVTTALQNAPLAIAYMGGTPDRSATSYPESAYWNANVMIEVGYRLASRMPMVFMCDREACGRMPDDRLPMTLRNLSVISLPVPPAGAENWTDRKALETVQRLVEGINGAQENPRFIDSLHPLAAIHATDRNTQSPESLYYTAASECAAELFGIADEDQPARLVGRSMTEFLESVKSQMHPVQWRRFSLDQTTARRRLSSRARDPSAKASTARVPIVFESHREDKYNYRAYLPIITQDYRPSENDWYSLRVLYLDVTTVTEKVVEDGDEFYVCRLDPMSGMQLEPLKDPAAGIKVFVSYSSRNRGVIEEFYDRLAGFKPYVDTFIDKSIEPGTEYPHAIVEALCSSEICFMFLDDGVMGDGQKDELERLLARKMSTSCPQKCRIVPVLLGRGRELPDTLSQFQGVEFEKLDDASLRQIFWTHFPDRCPKEWRMQDPPGGARMGQAAR